MSGCLVGLAWNLFVTVTTVIFRVIGFVLMLMVTALASLFVGVNTAIDRIAASWIEQFSGNGVNIGYTETSRNGAKVAAGTLLVVGWALNIVVIFLVLSMVVNFA